MQQPGSRRSETRRGFASTARWCARAIRGLSVGKLQSRLAIPGSTLSHHLKSLIIVGLITQERDATTLICRANYQVMRGLVDFLVAECCTEVSCAPSKRQTETAA